jgi:hypothetical protein
MNKGKIAIDPKAEEKSVKGFLEWEHVETALKLFALGVGLAYATGYLVVLTFLNEYGIHEAGGEVFKLRYIYVGALCLALPVVMACILQGLFSGSHKIPADAPAPTFRHFLGRLFAPAENMPVPLLLMLVNLSFVFYCIIAFGRPGLFAAKQMLVDFLYAPLLATLFLRLIVGKEKLWSRPLIFVRWVLVLVSVAASVLILKDIDFGSMIRERAYNYVALLTLLFFFVYRFTKWPLLGSVAAERNSRLIVRLMVLGPLFVLTVLSFAHVVYNHIPSEKGGGDFSWATDSVICFSDSNRDSLPQGLLQNAVLFPVCTVPVKIIEETGSDIYVARSSDRGSYSEKDAPNPAALWRSGQYYPVVFQINHDVISNVIILNRGKVEIVSQVPTSPQPKTTDESGQVHPQTAPKSAPRKIHHP